MTVSLPPMPPNVARLPCDQRGYPVPFFVQWEADGVPCDPEDEGARPIFPVMDSRKLHRAVREQRCWVCGLPLERRRAYVVGPMCVVNRTSAEPPSHEDCGLFAAQACPFLANPARRRKPRYEGAVDAAGIPNYRNPGVAVLWPTKGTKPRRARGGGVLFDIGDPAGDVQWFAHGRPATRDEALASMDSGVETLREVASQQGTHALLELSRLHSRARRYLPAAA